MKSANNTNIFAGDRAYKTNFFLQFRSKQIEQKYREETYIRNRYEIQGFLTLSLIYFAVNFMQSDCYLLNYCCLNRELLIFSMLSLIAAFLSIHFKSSMKIKILQVSMLPVAIYMYSTFLDKYSYDTAIILMTLYTCLMSYLVQPVWFLQLIYSISAYTLFFLYTKVASLNSFLRKTDLEVVFDLFIYNAAAAFFLGYVEKNRKERWVLLDTFKKSERIFRKVYEELPYPKFIVDKDKRILYTNFQGLHLLSNYANGCNSCNLSKKAVYLNEIIDKDCLKTMEDAFTHVSSSKEAEQCYISLRVPDDENLVENSQFRVEKLNYYRTIVSSVVWKNSFSYMVTLRNYSSKRKSEMINKKALGDLVRDVEDVIKKCESFSFEKDPNKFKAQLLVNMNTLRLSVFNTQILFNHIFEKKEQLQEDVNFNIQKSILNTLATLSPAAKERATLLQLKFEPSFPNLVSGDEHLFEQIFFNALLVIIQNLSNTKLSIDCNLSSFDNGKLLLSFEFDFDISKTGQMSYNKLQSNLEATKTLSLDHFIESDKLLSSVALIESGVAVFEGTTEVREFENSINFTINLPFRSHENSKQTHHSLFPTFEVLNFGSTSKPSPLSYQWNEEKSVESSPTKSGPILMVPSPADSKQVSPQIKKGSLDDHLKHSSKSLYDQSSGEFQKNKLMEGLQKLKEGGKNFGGKPPSPLPYSNSDPASSHNTMFNNEPEKIPIEKKEEGPLPGSEQGAVSGSGNLNGHPKLTKKKTQPRIMLKKPEDLKNIETGDMNDPAYIQDILLLYQRYEHVLKMSIASSLMSFVEKFKEQKKQTEIGEIKQTRSMLENLTFQERFEGSPIDENQLYGKIVAYLSKKLESHEFQNTFADYLEQLAEDLRKEIEVLQEGVQVFPKKKMYGSISAEPSEYPQSGSGTGENSPVQVFRRAATTFSRDLIKELPPQRKTSEISFLTLDSERSKERSLTGRLLLSPSMSTMASKAIRHPNRHFSDPFKQAGLIERNKSDTNLDLLSKAEKLERFQKQVLPFGISPEELPAQLTVRLETLKRRWFSVNPQINSKYNKSFTYNDVFTILVVDDSNFVWKAISALQVRYKTQLEFAKNGSEALMKYTHNAEQGVLYHLILMDLQMPIMDGFETTRHIRGDEQRKMYPETYICAMSAFEVSEVGNRAKREGMNNFCQKPLRLEILNNLIKTRCQEIGISLPEQVNQ